MAQIDVKITDLESITNLNASDLFLVSKNLTNSNVVNQNIPYTSNSISAGAIKKLLEKTDFSISGIWNFHGGKTKLPTQDTKLDIDNIVEAIKNDDKRRSIINDTSGWYANLSSSFLQNGNKRVDRIQSLSVTNNTIPNIDFVQRLIADVYDHLVTILTPKYVTYTYIINKTNNTTVSAPMTVSESVPLHIAYNVRGFDVFGDVSTTSGYSFAGWATNSTTTSISYSEGQSSTRHSAIEISLYPIIEKNNANPTLDIESFITSNNPHGTEITTQGKKISALTSKNLNTLVGIMCYSSIGSSSGSILTQDKHVYVKADSYTVIDDTTWNSSSGSTRQSTYSGAIIWPYSPYTADQIANVFEHSGAGAQSTIQISKPTNNDMAITWSTTEPQQVPLHIYLTKLIFIDTNASFSKINLG